MIYILDFKRLQKIAGLTLPLFATETRFNEKTEQFWGKQLPWEQCKHVITVNAAGVDILIANSCKLHKRKISVFTTDFFSD